MNLSETREALRTRIGKHGVWARRDTLSPLLASEIEGLGFGSLWVGGSPPADLADVEALLDATHSLVVATGIVNIWRAPAAAVAASFRRIEARHPGRFVLGIGVGHPENDTQAARPYGGLVDYLDDLDTEGVPADRRVLAALGDRVLALAAERALGAHPYFTPPSHTAHARDVMGPGALLIPEQRITTETDADAARALLRPGMARYFTMRNYRANLLRLGYHEADLDAVTDDVLDSIAAWGPAAAPRVAEHLAAGADHVVVQVVPPAGVAADVAYRDVAEKLGM